MIISKSYAEKLVRSGKADHVGYCLRNDNRYAIINRYDLQRTDHVLMASHEMIAACKRRKV